MRKVALVKAVRVATQAARGVLDKDNEELAWMVPAVIAPTSAGRRRALPDASFGAPACFPNLSTTGLG